MLQIFKKLRNTQLYFDLFEKNPSNFEIVGSCKKTGTCCKNLILVDHRGPVKNRRTFERMKKRDSMYEMFSPHDKTYSDGLLRFRCKNHLADNTCGIYERRPEMCRQYPQSVMVSKHGGGLLPGCGYKIVPKQSFQSLLEEKREKHSKLRIIQ